MPNLDDLQVFCQVVRYKGISAAAKAGGMQRSKVSRRLQELERKLGYQLLIRTTHTIELTEQGRWLYEQTNSHLTVLEEVMTVLEEQNREPKGTLRIAIPPVLGVTEFFTDVIEHYTSLYPKVAVEVEHQKQPIDLRRTNTDIQVLPVYSQAVDDDFVQQYFLELPCSVVASVDYIERHGEPSSIDDLRHHKLLGSRYSKLQLPEDFQYVVYSEDMHLLRNLARDGKGIAMLPTVMLKWGIEEGILKPLLTDHRFSDLKTTLIYASQPYLSQRCRKMVQLLKKTAEKEGLISYPA